MCPRLLRIIPRTQPGYAWREGNKQIVPVEGLREGDGGRRRRYSLAYGGFRAERACGAG